MLQYISYDMQYEGLTLSQTTIDIDKITLHSSYYI